MFAVSNPDNAGKQPPINLKKPSIHLVVKTLTGDERVYELGLNQTIGEFRDFLADAFKLPWGELNIQNIIDQNGNRLCTIFQDDPSNVNMLDFIKKEAAAKPANKDKQLSFDNLNVYITFFYDPRHRRYHERIPLEKYAYYDPDCKLVALLHKQNLPLNYQNERAGVSFHETLNELLTQKNENPNKKSKDGFTGIGVSLVFQPQSVLRKLVWYNGDPRKDFLAWDQFQYLLHWFPPGNRFYKRLGIISANFVEPVKPFKLPSLKLISMEVVGQTLHTTLLSDNQFIHLELCESPVLSKEALKEIFKLYRNYFEPSPTLKGTIEDFFTYEVEGNMKFVESVKLKDGSLGGMNLYEFVFDAKYPDTIFVHISCIFIIEKLRGRGLADPLVTSLPHAMPKLFEGKNIVYVFQSISYGSAKLVEGLLDYFPKIRNPYSAGMADTIIHHIQRDAVLVNKPMRCYSEIEVQVVKPVDEKAIPKVAGSREAFFNYFRGVNVLAKKKPQAYEHRGVLYMVKVSKESKKKYITSTAAFDFDGENYLNCFAENFAKLIPKLKPKFNPNPVLPEDGAIAATPKKPFTLIPT